MEHNVYIPLSSQAEAIIAQRYLHTGESGWNDVASRVSTALFGDDRERAERFELALRDRRFLPNSPALANLGNGGFTHACLVRNISDSYDGPSGITNSIAWMMGAQKHGSGTGFSLSAIRPAGSPVGGSNGIASGPLSFLKIFDMATSVTKQGGFRRGANMAVLDWSHGDALEFARIKSTGAACEMTCDNPSHYHNFNFSLAIDKSFWEALDRHDPHAASLWDAIMAGAWTSGDPGMWFKDITNEYNPTPWLGDYETTNPCGETPLLNNESCVLGSINLLHYLQAYRRGGEVAYELDWDALGQDIPLYIDALDRMIDVAVYPSQDIEDATKLTRKVGLGYMGLADVLAFTGHRYSEWEARVYAEKIAAFIQFHAGSASMQLGDDKGRAPVYEGTRVPACRRRNAIVTTVAPTGTISLIAGVTGGIEPLFAVEAESHRYLDPDDPEKVTVEHIVHAPYQYLREHGGNVEYYQEAHDIKPMDHLRMQAAIQRHVENAVSKTINVPHHITPAEIGAMYRAAYDLRCKGVTIYRDGSKGESPWQKPKSFGEICPTCGGAARRSESCIMCNECGSMCDI